MGSKVKKRDAFLRAEVTLPDGSKIKRSVYPGGEEMYQKNKKMLEDIKSSVSRRGAWWELHKFYWKKKRRKNNV